MKYGFLACFQLLFLTFKDLCLSLTWETMLSWQCRNLLMSTLSINYRKHLFLFEFWNKNPRVYQVGWTCYCVNNWFYWRWTLLFYVDLYENKITKSINHTFGACHLHAQPKSFHFVELSFWNIYSKLKRQHNLVWCKNLRLKLLATCKCFFFFFLGSF